MNYNIEISKQDFDQVLDPENLATFKKGHKLKLGGWFQCFEEKIIMIEGEHLKNLIMVSNAAKSIKLL